MEIISCVDPSTCQLSIGWFSWLAGNCPVPSRSPGSCPVPSWLLIIYVQYHFNFRHFKSTGTYSKEKFRKENFQSWFGIAGGRFSFLLEPSTNKVWRGEDIQNWKTILKLWKMRDKHIWKFSLRDFSLQEFPVPF